MKTVRVLLIAVLLLIINNSNAQTGPTKQQTVTELNNLRIGSGRKYFAHNSRYGKEKWKEFDTYKFSLDENNDCLLIFDWTESYVDMNNNANDYSDKPQRKIMDMSKVKTIYFTLTSDADDSVFNGERKYTDPSKYFDYAFNLNMNFIIVDNDGKEVETIIISLSKFVYEYNNGDPRKTNYNEEYKGVKINKVFNHLRKLCGAPEPLSWD